MEKGKVILGMWDAEVISHWWWNETYSTHGHIQET